MPERCTACWMTCAPSSGAFRLLSEPNSAPDGVRTAPTIIASRAPYEARRKEALILTAPKFVMQERGDRSRGYGNKPQSGTVTFFIDVDQREVRVLFFSLVAVETSSRL